VGLELRTIVRRRWGRGVKRIASRAPRRDPFASQGVRATPKPASAKSGERGPPLTLGDVAEPVAEALDADADKADAGPGVEQPEFGRARWHLEKAENGAQDRQATVGQCRFSARLLARASLEQSEHRGDGHDGVAHGPRTPP
jgi:hypothetical protein